MFCAFNHLGWYPFFSDPITCLMFAMLLQHKPAYQRQANGPLFRYFLVCACESVIISLCWLTVLFPFIVIVTGTYKIWVHLNNRLSILVVSGLA